MIAAAFGAMAAAAIPTGALAQSAPSLSVEFNGLEASDNGCRMTFVVNNGFPGTLQRATFEFALFDKAGVVDRLSVLEFKDLAPAKTKVTRFNLTGLDCANVGRILINEVTACEGESVDVAACRAALKTSSKAEGVEFGL